MLESANVPTQGVPCEQVLADFHVYLAETKGVRQGTQRVYVRHVREFLNSEFRFGIMFNQELSGRVVFRYITEHASRGRVVATKLATTALRSFIRYLVIRGKCDASLINSVPPVCNRKLSRIPTVLSKAQVDAILASFDRTTPLGLRNYAIVLCLAHLGLRSGDVVHLTLDDVNWRSGTLRVQGEKSRRASVMPVPYEVGSAIAAYVLKGRPITRERRIFVSHARGSQKGMPVTSSAIWPIVHKAAKRCEIDTTRVGAHTLRHTFASHMLQNGVELKQIADVLGHRSLNATFLYTKVDLRRLSEVTQPWPVVKP
ncbi:MAG: site-specific integrase [Firmicutes bacterium]|jgi:site-specific recombinase XerD|nr:site-specific integrase [Bacillota bacterium]